MENESIHTQKPCPSFNNASCKCILYCIKSYFPLLISFTFVYSWKRHTWRKNIQGHLPAHVSSPVFTVSLFSHRLGDAAVHMYMDSMINSSTMGKK